MRLSQEEKIVDVKSVCAGIIERQGNSLHTRHAVWHTCTDIPKCQKLDICKVVIK